MEMLQVMQNSLLMSKELLIGCVVDERLSKRSTVFETLHISFQLFGLSSDSLCLSRGLSVQFVEEFFSLGVDQGDEIIEGLVDVLFLLERV